MILLHDKYDNIYYEIVIEDDGFIKGHSRPDIMVGNDTIH